MQERTKTPEFTERQWAALAKWLPRGNRAGDTRQTVTAMLHHVKTGGQWEYLPADLGNPDAVSRTWERWAQAGVFRRAFVGLFPPCDRNLAAVAIDGVYVPVALEAHGARAAPADAHDCPRPDKGCVGQPPLYCPVHQAIGRQIYQSTNLVLMVDANAEIIDWRILPGNFPEAWATLELLAGLCRAGAVIADGRHNTKAVRAAVAALGAASCIPGRGESKDWVLWRLRNTVERAHNPLLRYHRVAFRCDKTAASYDASVALAALHVGLRRRYPDA